MRLIADGNEIAHGTKEHCMSASNSITMAERKQYNTITINYDNGDTALVLKKAGEEQKASINDIE